FHQASPPWSPVTSNRSTLTPNERRQRDRESRTGSRLARHDHIAAHHRAELLRDRQPQPGSPVTPRRSDIRLTEGLKQSAELLFAHADPCIGDRETYHLSSVGALSFYFQGHGPLFGE